MENMHVSVNLANKLHFQLAKYKDPIVVMNQLMYKRIFPNVAVHDLPKDGTSVFDSLSELDIYIDNSLPGDRIDIMDRED